MLTSFLGGLFMCCCGGSNAIYLSFFIFQMVKQVATTEITRNCYLLLNNLYNLGINC